MTETLCEAETAARPLGPALAEWQESPPPSLSRALAELGWSTEGLEEQIRTGFSTEEVEAFRRILVQAAAGEDPEDAALLARLTPMLDPRERAWDRVMRAKSDGSLLSGTVVEAVRGGLVVDLGVRGFIPASQVGLSVPRNLHQYVGRTLKFRVVEVDRRRQTVILSNRQVMEEERQERRRNAMDRLEEGQERRGIVRRLTEIGAFVDVGGVDGLLHVSEISWKRVENPADVLKVGQKIQVKVLRVDPDRGRVSLSMRQLVTDPWDEARRKYAIGTVHNVRISAPSPQGALLELDEGLDGLIPLSELAARKVQSVEEVVQPGQTVDAVVIDLRPREQRVVFSIRKMEQKAERQAVDTYQQKARTVRSDRTTLGDLFGHLFEEWREESAAPSAGREPAVEAPTAEPSATQDAAVGVVAESPEEGLEALADESLSWPVAPEDSPPPQPGAESGAASAAMDDAEAAAEAPNAAETGPAGD